MKFELKKDPIFREKPTPEIAIGETSFSEEMDNLDNPSGLGADKRVSMINKENNDLIGSIYYDYPKETSEERILRVRLSALENKYIGQGTGILLYEKLLALAKEKNLEGIGSDAVLSGGALAVWKKLQDNGYLLTVKPTVEGDWRDFVRTYNEGKVYKQHIAVGRDDSVIKILFNNQKA